MRIVNFDLEQRIRSGETFPLELGSGPINRKTKYYTLDIDAFEGVDIAADLNAKLDLLPDDCVSQLYTRHTLEHVRNLTGLMEEIQRVCIPGAEVKIIIPHFSNTFAHSDPTHVRLFGVYSMFYFCDVDSQPRRKVPYYYSKARFVVQGIKIRFYRLDWFDRIFTPIMERIVNINMSTKLFYERHLAYIFPAWEIEFSLRTKK